MLVLVYYYYKKSRPLCLNFLCSQPTTGSSNGRGPRCAAWMQDYIDGVGGGDLVQAEVMTGGIRGWVRTYGGRMVDGYDEEAWRVKLEEGECRL